MAEISKQDTRKKDPKKVKALENHRLELEFDDGTRGIADVSHLVGKGVFEDWKDPEHFRQVSIGDSGELTWPSGQDLCPDALYLRVTGKRPEDLYPALSREAASA